MNKGRALQSYFPEFLEHRYENYTKVCVCVFLFCSEINDFPVPEEKIVLRAADADGDPDDMSCLELLGANSSVELLVDSAGDALNGYFLFVSRLWRALPPTLTSRSLPPKTLGETGGTAKSDWSPERFLCYRKVHPHLLERRLFWQISGLFGFLDRRLGFA